MPVSACLRTLSRLSLSSRSQIAVHGSVRRVQTYQVLFAKAMDRGKNTGRTHKGSAQSTIDQGKLSELQGSANLTAVLEKEVDYYKDQLAKELTLRNTAQVLEQLSILLPSEPTPKPLNHIARVVLKTPQQAIINCATCPDAVKPIKTAIEQSGLNLGLQLQGSMLYVALPKLTREHREQLAKNAKTLHTKLHDRMRKTYSTWIKSIEENAKSQPDVMMARKFGEEQVRIYAKKAEELMKNKQNELLAELK